MGTQLHLSLQALKILMGPFHITYVLRRKCFFGDVRSLCKSLAFWFSLHYVFNLEYDKAINEFAIFYQ